VSSFFDQLSSKIKSSFKEFLLWFSQAEFPAFPERVAESLAQAIVRQFN